MNGSNWIALVAVASTALVGTAGLWFARKTSREDRDARAIDSDRGRAHVEAMARAERYFAARLDAYREAARMLERDRIHVQRTHPILVVGEPDPPPEPYSADEWAALRARIAVASSPDVLTSLTEADQSVREFVGAAMVFTTMREQGGTAAQRAGAFEQMTGARERAFQAIDNALETMRTELRGL